MKGYIRLSVEDVIREMDRKEDNLRYHWNVTSDRNTKGILEKYGRKQKFNFLTCEPTKPRQQWKRKIPNNSQPRSYLSNIRRSRRRDSFSHFILSAIFRNRWVANFRANTIFIFSIPHCISFILCSFALTNNYIIFA